VKKSIALLLALILGMSLLAGCGAKDPGTSSPAGEPLKLKFYSLILANDWIFYSNSAYLSLKLGNPESNVKMDISSATLVTADKQLEDSLKKDGSVQGKNLTYANIEFFVVERTERKEITLITAKAHPVKDADKTLDLVLRIELSGATLEQAEPVLKSLKINEETFAVVHTWPESEFVDLAHFSYTVKGGWYLHKKFEEPYSPSMQGRLKQDKPLSYMEIDWYSSTPDKVIDIINHAFASCIKRDDVTIAGITYEVYASDAGLGDVVARNTFLVAPIDSGGTIRINISSVGAEGAMSVLETIKLK
jgi:hypothetical protein